MKSLVRRRREAGAVCCKCGSPDYRIEPNEIDGCKPWIICNSCGERWMFGRDGGIYGELATAQKEVRDERH